MSPTRPPNPALFADIDEPSSADSTFNGAATRNLTHCYHDYPTRMNPHVAAKIIEEYGRRYGRRAKLILDPYCGTGTSLVEGMVRGIDCIGTDINPLARLIATAKTELPTLRSLDRAISRLRTYVQESPSSEPPSSVPGITDLEFWFQPSTLGPLTRLLEIIRAMRPSPSKTFLMVALSETVRESSNTQASEFKLHRYSSDFLKTYQPDVHAIFESKIRRNRLGLVAMLKALKSVERRGDVKVSSFNSVIFIPPLIVKYNNVDLVVTSPPHVDSQSTVAYGQYSRLSASWLGLVEPDDIDRRSMGGRRSENDQFLISPDIRTAIHDVRKVDPKRAAEVTSFYLDLQSSIKNVSWTVKRRKYACYVVHNRKVKGVVLPTSRMVRDVFESAGFSHVGTFTRGVQNKRMPLKNSPSDQAGQRDATMSAEYVVVMRKN